MNCAPSAVVANQNAMLWTMVQQFMQRHTGNVLRDDQQYMMESRLLRPAKAEGFSSVTDYVLAVCKPESESRLKNQLIDALTTHETMFFRDQTFWQGLQQHVLPTLFERAAKGLRVRIWSAACSTGQEPYSLAMLLKELQPDLAARFEIIATDIAEPTVKHAKEGFFTALETNRGLDIKRLARFFVQAPGGFRVNDELRSLISWQTHNLLGSNPDPANCDLVLCRNVLIYFNDSDRNLALKRLTRAIAANGFFAIGATESCRPDNLQPLVPGIFRLPY